MFQVEQPSQSQYISIFLGERIKLDCAKEEILTHHHHDFITQVGVEALINIPSVEAHTLKLDKKSTYHERVVTPDLLGSESVVRGVDGSNRPFIAIKVDLLGENGDKIDQVVELIFKRYPLNGHGANEAMHGLNYVTALTIKGQSKNYASGLYVGKGMSFQEMHNVGRLLRGEKVYHQYEPGLWMQKA